MRQIAHLFHSLENKLLTIIGILIGINTLLYTEFRSTHAWPFLFDNKDIYHLIYLILFVFLIGTIAFFSKKSFSIFKSCKKIFWTLLPFEFSLIIGLFIVHSNVRINGVFFLFSGAYIIAIFVFIINKYLQVSRIVITRKNIRGWFRSQGKAYFATLALIMTVSLFFGTYQIGHYAAVDEPLWTFDRVPGFWKNVGEQDWKNTTVSDKPGVTVAIISGLGLTKVDPMEYEGADKRKSDLDISVMNTALRLPLLLFCILSLPIFFIFIQQLLDKRTALIATALVATAPVTIGMARIINPDGLLWVFAPLSLFAYLAYLKKRHRFLLVSAGILLGLSVLTKYVANILYVFFFGLIFFEYIFTHASNGSKTDVSRYIKRACFDFFSITAISLMTFYLLFPATWVQPMKLFKGTLLSQAFVSTAPIFIAIIAFLIIDTFFLKNRILTPLFNYMNGKKRFFGILISVLFLTLIAFVLADVYLGMKPFDFEAILSSPKSAFLKTKFLGIFTANFYPLVFATTPLALAAAIHAIISGLRKKDSDNHIVRITSYCLIFIMLYYLGTTVNDVASPVRYQIMLFPVLLLVSAIGLERICAYLKKTQRTFWIITTITILTGAITLFHLKPFYLSYASSLLPSQYITDVKDMGAGSYEAAEFLNTLPGAENIAIWTDKRGVCTFFVGRCYDGFSFDELEAADIEYVVVSSGRENRTTSITKNRIRLNSSEKLRFSKYYTQKENAVFELYINARPNNFVKVFEAK